MTGDVLGGNAKAQLRSIIDRCENVIHEREEINEQLKEILAEAKGNGYDVPIIRKLLRIRRMDRAKRQEGAAILALYASATDDPLGDDECELV